MAPRALLLSPDDQAVSAITGVLEELSVSCERPMDGVSAAKKLNSERFDLVVVDCENLPAAKLIFDVCRRAHGPATVPVAIVDGAMGLPTAFRLGAELILTKPVAKDQARITIRTAVSRVKKEQPAGHAKPVDADHEVEAQQVKVAEAHHDVKAEAVHQEEQESRAPKALAQAAAAGAGSFALKELAVGVLPAEAPSIEPVASAGSKAAAALPVLPVVRVDGLTSAAAPIEHAPAADSLAAAAPILAAVNSPEISSEATQISVITASVALPAEEIISSPLAADSVQSANFSESSSISGSGATSSSKISIGAVVTVKDKDEASSTAQATSPAKSSGDPVVAVLKNDEPVSKSPIFSSYEQPKERRGRGLLLSAMMLAVAAGGFYYGWTYQPGFQEFIQVRISQTRTLLGLQSQHTTTAIRPIPAPVPSKPSTEPALAPLNVSAAPSAATAGATSASSAVNTPGVTAPPVSANPAPNAASAAPSADVNSPLAATPSATTAPAADDSTAAETQKKTAAAGNSRVDLPEAKNAVILSSKGAEKRLLRHVTPVVPAGARSHAVGATVVLKAAIDKSGTVAGVRLVEGDPVLADAAIKAVKQWRYRPFTRDGKALPFQTIVLVDFQ